MSNWMIMHTNHWGDESGTGVIQQNLRMHAENLEGKCNVQSSRKRRGKERRGRTCDLLGKKEGCNDAFLLVLKSRARHR